MEIPFNIGGDEVLLIADENNYCLARRRERIRDGVITTELEAFKWFADIGSALNRVIDMKVKRSDTTTLLGLKKVIEESRDEVVSAWRASA